MSDQELAGPEEAGQLSFWEHLSELRQRLIYSVAALVVGFVVAWIFKESLFAIVSAPVKEGLAAHGIYRLTAIETIEAIMVYLKLSLAAAIVVTIPVSLWQIWQFVKPGLVETETRPMRRIAVLAVFMFALGLIFSYRFVLPLVIDFLTGFTLAAGDVDFQVTMKSTYSTTLIFLVGFGVIFELPLVMVLLAATPLFDSRKYLKWIRYSVVIAFVIGSMLTPPDVLSQSLMAVPITILYVIGIGMTYLSERRRAQGRPPATGLDWQLLLSVLVLSGLIGAMVMPTSRPQASYLPYGARTVFQANGILESTLCGGLWPGDSDTELDELVCGIYNEGAVLLVNPSAAESGVCPLLGRAEGKDCLVIDGTTAVGNGMLLARYANNREQRLVDSDPLALDDDALSSLFVSLQSTPREQRAYLRVVELGGDRPSVRLDLSFGDPKEARHFVDSLTGDAAGLALGAGGDAATLSRQDEALLELAAVLDVLKAGLPAEEASLAQTHLDRARKLLGQMPGDSGMSPARQVLNCSTSPCAFAAFAGIFPEPDEPQIRGRVVTLTFAADKTDLPALRALLGGIVVAAGR